MADFFEKGRETIKSHENGCTIATVWGRRRESHVIFLEGGKEEEQTMLKKVGLCKKGRICIYRKLPKQP